MPLHGVGRRRGLSDAFNFPKNSAESQARPYHTPPASRSSEPQSRTRGPELENGFRWHEVDSSSRDTRDLSTNPFELFRRNETFFNKDENDTEVPLGEELRFRPGHRSQRSRDDYGVAYSFYQNRSEFSPPRTPDDDCLSLDWDSTYDPFTSTCFRRGSLVLDPAAFDSTPSVNQFPPPSPGGTNAALKLKKSAEALKEFGKKVLPRLKINTREQAQSEHESIYNSSHTQRPSPGSSSQPATRSSSGRTRSNTLESNRSAWSKASAANSQSVSQSVSQFGDVLTREQLEDSSDVLSPLATYRSTHGPTASITSYDANSAPASPLPKSTSNPPVASSATPTTTLPTLVERSSRAPSIAVRCESVHFPYNGTDPGVEELMRLMQEEDESYALTEQRMVQSGWSTDNEINNLRERRQEQQNLWQRRLDDAVDQLKAQISLD